MGSQLISNAVRSFFLAMVLTALLTGSVAEAASYQKTDGTIIDPILDKWGITHSHSGSNLEPGANLRYANLTGADLIGADLLSADLYYANLTIADLYGANLSYADLYSTNLTDAYNVETSTGSPCYYGNTVLPAGFDSVAQGWILAPYCDFTPDAVCDLADINQMFQAGNLVTGVATSGDTDRLDLVDNDTIDAADITEWLAQAATANGHGSPCLRGDTDITDFNLLAAKCGRPNSTRT